VHAIFRHDYPLGVEPASKYDKGPSTKKTLRDSVPIVMLLSALSFLVVAQSSSEVPEGLMNNPVLLIEQILHSTNELLPVGDIRNGDNDTLLRMLPNS